MSTDPAWPNAHALWGLNRLRRIISDSDDWPPHVRCATGLRVNGYITHDEHPLYLGPDSVRARHSWTSPPGPALGSAPGVPHEKCFPRRPHMGTGTASEGFIRPVRVIPARERRLGVRDSAAPGLRAEEPSVYGNRRPVIFPLFISFIISLLFLNFPLTALLVLCPVPATCFTSPFAPRLLFLSVCLY